MFQTTLALVILREPTAQAQYGRYYSTPPQPKPTHWNPFYREPDALNIRQWNWMNAGAIIRDPNGQPWRYSDDRREPMTDRELALSNFYTWLELMKATDPRHELHELDAEAQWATFLANWEKFTHQTNLQITNF